jgi:hypothetical protein
LSRIISQNVINTTAAPISHPKLARASIDSIKKSRFVEKKRLGRPRRKKLLLRFIWDFRALTAQIKKSSFASRAVSRGRRSLFLQNKKCFLT